MSEGEPETGGGRWPQGARQGSPKGNHPDGVGRQVPRRGSGPAVVRGQLWPAERCCGHCGSGRTTDQPQDDALLVLGLPVVLQREDGYRAGGLEREAAEVGVGDLPGADEPEGGVEHEAAPGHRSEPRRRRGSCSTGYGRRSRPGDAFAGPVRGGRDLHGGREKNEPKGKRAGVKGLRAKTAVIAALDRKTGRLRPRSSTRPGPHAPGLRCRAPEPGATVYTDGDLALPGHDPTIMTSAAQRGRIRPGNGRHQPWRLLVHAQTGSQGSLPQLRPRPPAVCERVRGTAEHPGQGHQHQMRDVVCWLVRKPLLYRDLSRRHRSPVAT